MCRKYESLIHGFNDDAPADTDGDPFDFDDRMDAFADPFGFGGDGDPVD